MHQSQHLCLTQIAENRQPVPTLSVLVLGLFVFAESDVVKRSNADVWGILVFVAVVLLSVWIVRRVRRNV
jgi:hypothetical protein